MSRQNLIAFVVLIVVAGLSTGCLGAAQSGLNIYWVDVEGGAATLIVTPAGESVLIDTGNPGQRDSGRINNLARNVAGLKKIDHLITTHFHGDHFGGAAPLSKLIPIGTVWDYGKTGLGRDKVTPAYFAFSATARKVIKPGDTLPLKQADGSAPISITC